MKEITEKNKKMMIEGLEAKAKEVKLETLQEALKKLEKNSIEVPRSYDTEGLEAAISVLGGIQKLRDIASSLKNTTNISRMQLRRLWEMGQHTILTRDPMIKEFSSQTEKSAYIKSVSVLEKVYSRYMLAETLYANFDNVLENLIAKFNTCSRQIKVLELQIEIGEIEAKRKRT